jgi:hypothetical protein
MLSTQVGTVLNIVLLDLIYLIFFTKNRIKAPLVNKIASQYADNLFTGTGDVIVANAVTCISLPQYLSLPSEKKIF